MERNGQVVRHYKAGVKAQMVGNEDLSADGGGQHEAKTDMGCHLLPIPAGPLQTHSHRGWCF